MEAHERRDLTTKEFFRVLQESVAPRLLVDKSPTYALDPGALRRAEAYFEEPFYIHLVRHPATMVRSFEAFHMDRVLMLEEHDFTPRQVAELVWYTTHRNAVAFLAAVPAHRQCRIRYEDLAARPRETMERLCAALGLPFHEDLLDPYKDVERKMIDGVHPDSPPMGDTKFRGYGRIEPRAADTGQGVGDDLLGDLTWELAEQLGYERPLRPGAEGSGRAGAGRRRLSRQRALRTRHRTLQGGG
jgi:hypothetical protein